MSGHVKLFRNLDRKLGLPLLRFAVERVVLGGWSAPKKFTRRLLRRRLGIVGPLVDGAFYVRQQVRQSSMRAAASDAALHYLLIGRFHNLAPNAEFDPIAYREHNTHLSWVDDPLSDFAAGQGRLPSPRGASPATNQGQPIMTVHHGRGGGSGHYLELLEDDLRASGFAVLRLARVSLGRPLFRADGAGGTASIGVFDLVAEADRLTELLLSRNVARVIVNHVVDLQPEALGVIADACVRSRVPYDVHVHDYIYLCPRIDCVDAAGHYCGAPLSRPCLGCVLKTDGRPPLARSVWRERARAFLSAADQVFAPSQDTVDRYARHWPEITIRVRPPESDAGTLPPFPVRVPAGQQATVAMLGRLNVPKGFDIISALAKHIRRHRLPLRLVVIGPTIDDGALRRLGVVVHGRYRPDEAPSLLRGYAPHLVFLPAIWPETWSFVLSHVLQARLPVCAFDLGAISERLRALGFGHLLPAALARRPDLLAARLLSIVSGEGAAGHVAAEP